MQVLGGRPAFHRRGVGHEAGLRSRGQQLLRHQSVAYAAHTSRSSADAQPSSSGASLALESTSAPEIRLFYRTGWRKALVHGSLHGAAWQDFQLRPVASSQGQWLMSRIPVPADGAANGSVPLLEFVVTDGVRDWDKPAAGGNYAIERAGTFTLRDGTVAPVSGRPVLLVSDLDGTMVGDDKATAAFRQFWLDKALTRGSLLVYNTGRSLESFEALQREKGHCLAQPDVLISAVGTRVYHWVEGKGWQVDEEWRRTLDRGWNVDVVRDAAYKALAMVGKEKMHFRPPEEQNRHKITCGVHASVEEAVIRHINDQLFDGAVRANLIVSGAGDWRFLDVVPTQAGKLEATEYVRKKHGFALDATLACGDSGNDILMLSGESLAVVVGNAQPDLKAWAATQAAANPRRLCVASKHEAYGILEALERFGLH